jgi:hypothetical protein
MLQPHVGTERVQPGSRASNSRLSTQAVSCLTQLDRPDAQLDQSDAMRERAKLVRRTEMGQLSLSAAWRVPDLEYFQVNGLDRLTVTVRGWSHNGHACVSSYARLQLDPSTPHTQMTPA